MRYRTYESVAMHPRRLASPADSSLTTVRFSIPGHADATEELPVEALDGGWRLLVTPTMIDGCAAGDVVRVDGNRITSVRARGGNVGLLFEFERQLGDLPQLLAEVLDVLTGWVDGWQGSGRVAVFAATVPVEVGFDRIEDEAASFADRHGGSWFYKNVYDATGGPLGWWEQ